MDMKQDEAFDDVEKQLEQLQHVEPISVATSEDESESEKSFKIKYNHMVTADGRKKIVAEVVKIDKVKYTHKVTADGRRKIMAEVVRIVKKTKENGSQKEQLVD